MIRIALLEFLLVLTPVAYLTDLVHAHITLGIGILVLAFYNAIQLVRTTVPARVKRITGATAQLSVAMADLGLLVQFHAGQDLVIPLVGISILRLLLFVHVVNAFAIVTQAAAVAIAYDMWAGRTSRNVSTTPPGRYRRRTSKVSSAVRSP